MTVISPTFEFIDFLPLIITFFTAVVLCVVVGVYVDGVHRGLSPSLVVGIGLGTVCTIIVALGHLDVHHTNMKNDLFERFEDGYALTIVDDYPRIPLTTGDSSEAVKAFLHEQAGEQVIIIEIIGDEYVVTHNGEVREPVDSDS